MKETGLPRYASFKTIKSILFGFMWKPWPKASSPSRIGLLKAIARSKVRFRTATRMKSSPFLVSPLYICPNPGKIKDMIAAVFGSLAGWL